jgi:hypothetical protein
MDYNSRLSALIADPKTPEFNLLGKCGVCGGNVEITSKAQKLLLAVVRKGKCVRCVNADSDAPRKFHQSMGVAVRCFYCEKWFGFVMDEWPMVMGGKRKGMCDLCFAKKNMEVAAATGAAAASGVAARLERDNMLSGIDVASLRRHAGPSTSTPQFVRTPGIIVMSVAAGRARRWVQQGRCWR